jgi:hypothetical protein
MKLRPTAWKANKIKFSIKRSLAMELKKLYVYMKKQI